MGGSREPPAVLFRKTGLGLRRDRATSERDRYGADSIADENRVIAAAKSGLVSRSGKLTFRKGGQQRPRRFSVFDTGETTGYRVGCNRECCLLNRKEAVS